MRGGRKLYGIPPIRQHYQSSYVRAVRRLAVLLDEAGEYPDALGTLEDAIQVDPLGEDLWRHAMLLELRLGRRAAALARYRRLEVLLRSDCDTTPDPETQRLVHQMAGTSGEAMVR